MPLTFSPTTITDSGGYIMPQTGNGGFLNQSTQIPHTQGPSIIADIPEFQRDYNLRDALITRIEEGRLNMMRVLFDWASMNSAYSVDDTTPNWYLDRVPTPRFYLKTMANQGGTAGSAYTTGTFILEKTTDAPRLQTGDLIALMPLLVPPDRDANSVILDYVVSPTGGSIYLRKDLATAPLPEICRIKEVNYTTGAVMVERNVGGDGQSAARSGLAFTVVANGTGDPGASSIRAEDAFFLKMTRPMREGSDDATVWSRTNTRDFNHCQYIYRKWGVIDIQENVRRRGQPEGQYAKNRKEAIDQFFEELEYWAIFGFRYEDYDAANRWRGHSGGFLEAIPSGHYEVMQEPEYTSATKSGDFTIKRFNKIFENKFYYGSTTKILLCGAGFHTAFSWMINSMTTAVSTIVDSWSVRGRMFEISNGGKMIVIPSDTMTLNGMRNMAILFDPATFQYGHLQNMDIQIVDPLPTTNIHEKTGEIFGVFTFKRENFDANWVIVLQPNTES